MRITSENRILKELDYDPFAGALTYRGVRYLLIRPETIVEFQKAIREVCGKEVEDQLFQGGFTGGTLSSKRYMETHHVEKRDLVDFMMEMGSQIGWGRFRVELFDTKRKTLRVRVVNSPFSQAYGESREGVCHLIRGVLAGMASVLFGEGCVSNEVKCAARGDPWCLFDLRGKKGKSGEEDSNSGGCCEGA